MTAAARGRVAVLASGLAAVAAIGAFMLVNVAPSLAYTAEHGANDAPVSRSADESELFGLKLMQLLLPVDGHRLEPLARRRPALRADDDHAGEPAGVRADARPRRRRRLRRAAARGARRRRRRREAAPAARCSGARRCRRSSRSSSGSRPASPRSSRTRSTPKFHAPGRISIFIAFFSLLAVGVLLDAAVRRWAGPRRSGLVAATAAARSSSSASPTRPRPRSSRAGTRPRREWHDDEEYARDGAGRPARGRAPSSSCRTRRSRTTTPPGGRSTTTARGRTSTAPGCAGATAR